MSNKCDNILHLTGSTNRLKEFYKFIVEKQIFFELIKPIPETITFDTNEERDFCESEWGTKRDIIKVFGVELETINNQSSTLEMSFSTAWTPPIGIYDKLYEMGFEVSANYYE